MEKPENPATIDPVGIALLATLAEPHLLFGFQPAEPWCGEPLALPAAFYKEEFTPIGWSLLGWRLTAEGIEAWEALA